MKVNLEVVSVTRILRVSFHLVWVAALSLWLFGLSFKNLLPTVLFNDTGLKLVAGVVETAV